MEVQTKESTMALTAKLAQTYQFIKRYYVQQGYAPTCKEIAQGIGIRSRGVVHRYLKALQAQGYLELLPKQKRNIQLKADKHLGLHCELPIIGQIAAGQPIEAIQDQQTLNLTDCLMGHNRFILRAKGDSMIGDGIYDGDYIICESRQQAENGEIVVALIDSNETTLKRFRQNDERTIALIPSNPALPSMLFAAERVTIQGIYIGLLRLQSHRVSTSI